MERLEAQLIVLKASRRAERHVFEMFPEIGRPKSIAE